MTSSYFLSEAEPKQSDLLQHHFTTFLSLDMTAQKKKKLWKKRSVASEQLSQDRYRYIINTVSEQETTEFASVCMQV